MVLAMLPAAFAPAQAAAATVTGTVTLGTTGQPAAGFDVVLLDHFWFARHLSVRVIGEARTDAQGRYSMVTGPANGQRLLRVTDPSGAWGTTWFGDERGSREQSGGGTHLDVEEGGSVTADVRMQVPVQIVGTVRDASGAAVGGAEIEVHSYDNPPYYPFLVSVKAAADGTFATGGLPRGKVILHVVGRDTLYRPTWVTANGGSDDLADVATHAVADADLTVNPVVLPGASATGTAYGEVDPEDITIEVHSGQGLEATADVDAYARWRVVGLKPGNYRFFAVDRTGAHVSKAWGGGATVESGRAVRIDGGGQARGIDIVLDQAPMLRGQVKDVDGRPVRGLRVVAERADGGAQVGWHPDRIEGHDAWTDEDGHFQFYGLSERPVVVKVAGDGRSVPTQYAGTEYDRDASLTRGGAHRFVPSTVNETQYLTLLDAGTAAGTSRVAEAPAGTLVVAERRIAGGKWVAVKPAAVVQDNGTWQLPLVAGVHRFRWSASDGTARWVGGRSAATATSHRIHSGEALRGLDLVAAPVEMATAPKVKGKAKVGRSLSVSSGTWRPGKVTLVRTWQVKKGSRIVTVKGNRAKLRLASSHRGAKVRVKVTAKAPGQLSRTWTSSWRKVA